MEVAKDIFFSLVSYIQTKRIIRKIFKKAGWDFFSINRLLDWMEADLNTSLQSIVRKGWSLRLIQIGEERQTSPLKSLIFNGKI